MAKRRLLRAENICDRGPGDRLERRNGNLYLVNEQGYAPVQVEDRETTGLPPFLATCAGLLDAEQIGRWALMVSTALMSPEAKQARLEALQQRWHQLYGDALFVVV